jgi:hypothetical protein
LVLLVVSVLALVPTGKGGAEKPNAPDSRARSQATKRWTNDDIEELRRRSSVSVAGSVEPINAMVITEVSSGAGPIGRYRKEDDAQWYSEEIDARRTEIAIDQAALDNIFEIEDQGVRNWEPVPLDKNSPGLFLQGTIYVLQSEIVILQDEISDLQDLARERGIARDAWR